MATSSPGQSIHLKSPRSPRQLPTLPRHQQVPIVEQRSPTHSQSLTKSPGTPLVFEFPPEYYPETPNTNFDFDKFGCANELEQQHDLRSPSYYTHASPKSPQNSSNDILNSPGRKSPIFQLCDPRKNLKQAASYPTSTTSSMVDRNRTASSSSYGQRSPKSFERRRNSCFSLASLKSPMSPTIVMSSSRSPTSPKFDRNSEFNLKNIGREISGHNNNSIRKTSLEGSFSMQEKISETIDLTRSVKTGRHFNKSQGCLNEFGRNHFKGSDEHLRHGKSEKNMARRSTSDLTDMVDADTEITLLSSPRRRGSMKGGLG